MAKIDAPVIFETRYNDEAIQILNEKIEADTGEKSRYLLEYPTVYVINDKEGEQFTVYVGETTDIRQRSFQHLKVDPKNREDWEKLSISQNASMYVIGHNHFNKSLTLDIENKLMQYMSSVESVQSLYNRRYNQQNEYYTSDELDEIFSKVWRGLRRKNDVLFPLERVIQDSAIFKASPFHKLTEEQVRTKDFIILKIMEALTQGKEGQLILVEGEAGTGKTVLMSSLFYELAQLAGKESDNVVLKDKETYLLVNHNQQLKVYEQIAGKLGISKKSDDVVSKPTHFINEHSPEEKADVVLIDEAHLLLTRGKMSYTGKNQLKDILDRAKVVVAVFDPNQILSAEQYWERADYTELQHDAVEKGNYMCLMNQMRINADKQTVEWIRNLTDNQQVANIPVDKRNYDLQIFESPRQMFEAISQKAQNQNSGISRMVATFDWDYNDSKKPENEDFWRVKIGDWSLPWNLQLPQTRAQKRKNRHLSWAEQNQTINEVGSTFTVQGFDLNYAGVIIGPSVKFRNGKIIFDREASKNRNATQKRTLKNGKKEYLSDSLLKNELNVLLTRGVNGLYIYAVDEALQQALIKARKGELNE